MKISKFSFSILLISILFTAFLGIFGLSIFRRPAQAADFSFAVGGDIGKSSNTSATMRFVGMYNPAFYLGVGDMYNSGDNSDPNLESDWCAFVKAQLTAGGMQNSATFPFQIVTGNHEDDAQRNGYILDYAACMPDRMTSTGTYGVQYYFDYNNARFIMLSPGMTVDGTTYTYSSASPEYATVAGWIDDAQTANMDWIIVGEHKNCISAGYKGTCEMGQDLMNLLIQENVDLIFQGHEHIYQRSKQLQLNPDCLTLTVDAFNDHCVRTNTTSNEYQKGNGPVVVITGATGASISSYNDLDDELPYFISISSSNNYPTYGFTYVSVTSDAISAQFIPTAVGSYYDFFKISATPAGLTRAYDNVSSQSLVGDFDGDGDDDIALARIVNANTVAWYVDKSNRYGFTKIAKWISDFGNSGDQFRVGDFNSDGRDDIAVIRRISSSVVRWYVATSTGSSFVNRGMWSSDFGNASDYFFVGKFDTDGADEIAVARPIDPTTMQWYVGDSTGRSFVNRGIWSTDFGDGGDLFRVGDFTGDGRDDIAAIKEVNATTVEWYVARSNSHAFLSLGLWASDFGNMGDIYRVGDFNHDHKDDALVVSPVDHQTYPAYVSFSSGSAFGAGDEWSNGICLGGEFIRIGDFNADGRDDFSSIRITSTNVVRRYVGLSIGTDFAGSAIWAADFGNVGDKF